MGLDLPSGTLVEDASTNTGVWNDGLQVPGMEIYNDALVFGATTAEGRFWFSVDRSTWITTAIETKDKNYQVSRDGLHLVSRPFVAPDNGDDLCWYLGFDELAAADPTMCVSGFHEALRFTIHDGEVYAFWHSTHEVVVYDPSIGLERRRLPLEDWNEWVWGVDVASGMLHVLNWGDGAYQAAGTRVARFDVSTGAFIDHVFLSTQNANSYGTPTGLVCEELDSDSGE